MWVSSVLVALATVAGAERRAPAQDGAEGRASAQAAEGAPAEASDEPRGQDGGGQRTRPQGAPAGTSSRRRAVERGVTVVGADGVRMRLGMVLQVDGRAFPVPGAVDAPGTLLVRRARPIFELALGELFDVRVMPDFGEGKVVLYDAYVDVHPAAWLRLRAGKMKTGVGLQRLQPDQYYDMIERSFVTGLVPNREVGLQLHGEVEQGLVTYMAGIYNGAADRGASVDVDASGNLEVAGALWVRPFRATALAALADVALGVSGTYGRERGSAAQPGLASYVTPGQLPFFTYRKEAFAWGERRRVSPALYAYLGPLGVLAEYAVSAQAVSNGATTAMLAHTAWQVTAGVVVTGEDATYSGVTPARPLDLTKRQLGAVEVVTRAEEQRLDDAAFPALANPTTSARRAQGLGGGVNWYLTDQVKASLDYERTRFRGGGAAGDRSPENSVIGRLQVFL